MTKLDGEWQGELTYGKGYGKNIGKQLCFTIHLNQTGNLLNGTSIDTSGFHPHPESADINGTINNKLVSFTKLYPSLHTLDRNSKLVFDKSRKGFAVEFNGKLNETANAISGSWTIKSKWYLFGLFPWKVTNGGTWSIKKQQLTAVKKQ